MGFFKRKKRGRRKKKFTPKIKVRMKGGFGCYTKLVRKGRGKGKRLVGYCRRTKPKPVARCRKK